MEKEILEKENQENKDESTKEQETIDPVGHDYKITNTVYPTNDADGYTEYTCECGKFYKISCKKQNIY